MITKFTVEKSDFAIQVLRSNVSLHRPPDLQHQYGELYVNIADEQLGVIDENQQHMDLIAIRFFKNTASYKEGDHVVHEGHLYQAKQDITGPKNFDPADWSTSGADLSIADYDQDLPYTQGAVAFFPGQNCFLQAVKDLVAGSPHNDDDWEPICSGKSGGANKGDYAVGDVITTLHMIPDIEAADRRLVILHGQDLKKVGPYEDLYKVWGDQFGVGSVADSFRVPDMRGYVPRGVDESLAIDPDARNRAAQVSGANSGAMGGTIQGDQVGRHLHKFQLDEPANDAAGPKHGYHRGMVWNWHPVQQTWYHESSETRMKNIGVHWYAQF